MGVEIIIRKNPVFLLGYSDKVIHRNYSETGKRLMDELWRTVKSAKLKNSGINYWIYEANEMLFTGTEIEEIPSSLGKLERKEIPAGRYAYLKHTGPYSHHSEAYTNMDTELQARGFSCHLPFIEIYGHWVADESKLETEILLSLDEGR